MRSLKQIKQQIIKLKKRLKPLQEEVYKAHKKAYSKTPKMKEYHRLWERAYYHRVVKKRRLHATA